MYVCLKSVVLMCQQPLNYKQDLVVQTEYYCTVPFLEIHAGGLNQGFWNGMTHRQDTKQMTDLQTGRLQSVQCPAKH